MATMREWCPKTPKTSVNAMIDVVRGPRHPRQRKPLICASPLAHWCCLATSYAWVLSLQLSGDVHPNPGPGVDPARPFRCPFPQRERIPVWVAKRHTSKTSMCQPCVFRGRSGCETWAWAFAVGARPFYGGGGGVHEPGVRPGPGEDMGGRGFPCPWVCLPVPLWSLPRWYYFSQLGSICNL